ncbi:MAG: thermonuclease family protein [Agrobacterium cavarae]
MIHLGPNTIGRGVAAVFLLSSALLPSASPAGSEITGRASVIDGDTLDIQGARIRLHGIDAPESWQTCESKAGKPYRCGKAAAEALDAFLAASRPTSCQERDIDRYGRIVAVCFRADGQGVNEWMVATGNAVDWPRYSRGEFQAAQQRAKTAQAGIWSGSFIMPCEARAVRSGRSGGC